MNTLLDQCVDLVGADVAALQVEPGIAGVVDELELALVECGEPVVPVEQVELLGFSEGRAADADAIGLAGQARGPVAVGLAPHADLFVTDGFVNGHGWLS